MTGGWGSFRTIDGDAAVGDDALHIGRSPGKFLRGQRTRWHNGGRREQIIAAGKLLGFVLPLLFAVYQVAITLGTTTGMAAALSFGLVVLNLAFFLREHTREVTVELSAIESVTFDIADRELRLTHDTSGRLAGFGEAIRRWLSGDDSAETETSLTLATADDVRAARTVLRTRGITVEASAESETEYRYEMKNGVVFCARCGSQVSPNDRTCPVCERALKVERPVETDSRELREQAVEH